MAVLKEMANGVYNDNDSISSQDDSVGNISDSDLVGDIIKQRPRMYDGLSASIIIDGLPKVGPEKFEKLKTVILKLLSKYGNPVRIEYPQDSNGNNKEYMFVEFETPTQAMDIVKALELGHKLDKQHTLEVNSYKDINKYSELPEDIENLQPQPYVDRGNLRSWLLDKDCYDQFGIVHDQGMTTTIFTNSNPEPTSITSRQGWTESIICWSPLGTYLATCHEKGIALWAGEKFDYKIQRFSHEEVSLLDFSPSENFLVTFSTRLAQQGDQHAVIIWDIRSGAKKRWFPVEENQCAWPLFKWSHDDKYFAKMNQDALSVYGVNENPPFGLLDKKALKIVGIRGYSWSPSDNIIAFWVASDDNVRPARVVLMDMPSKTEIRSKQLFNVADCKMYWHKQGDYLCVQVHRYTKAKKEKNDEIKYSGLYYSYEIFNLRKKLIPVDSFEIKETVINFAWEPCGNKFGLITGEKSQHSVIFYEIKDSVKELKRFEGRSCTQLFWSTAGQFVLLANPRSGMVRTLEWVDTATMTVTAKNEHFMMTEVEWDPTGRYVVTSVSWWEHKADNAYWIWSFNGRLIRKQPIDGFCQFLWRPRPPTLLSAEKIAEIKKNLKNYSNQFDLKDKAASNQVSRTLQEKRKKLVNEFETFRQNKKQAYESIKQELKSMRDSVQAATKIEVVKVEEVEILVKEESSVMN